MPRRQQENPSKTRKQNTKAPKDAATPRLAGTLALQRESRPGRGDSLLILAPCSKPVHPAEKSKITNQKSEMQLERDPSVLDFPLQPSQDAVGFGDAEAGDLFGAGLRVRQGVDAEFVGVA